MRAVAVLLAGSRRILLPVAGLYVVKCLARRQGRYGMQSGRLMKIIDGHAARELACAGLRASPAGTARGAGTAGPGRPTTGIGASVRAR
jgi:hypothetical protein